MRKTRHPDKLWSKKRTRLANLEAAKKEDMKEDLELAKALLESAANMMNRAIKIVREHHPEAEGFVEGSNSVTLNIVFVSDDKTRHDKGNYLNIKPPLRHWDCGGW